jgi:hypothetical protein
VLSLRCDPARFVDVILEQNFSKRAVGFKLWRTQSEKACDHILQSTNTIKVILERKNKLAHMASCGLAEKTGVWNVSAADRFVATPDMTIGFQYIILKEFMAAHEVLFEYYRRMAKGIVVEMTYTQIASLDFRPLFEVLGIQPLALRPPIQRLYGENILNRFHESEHDMIIRELKEMGHPEWVLEKN